MSSEECPPLAIVIANTDPLEVCCRWDLDDSFEKYGIQMALWAHNLSSGEDNPEYQIAVYAADGSLERLWTERQAFGDSLDDDPPPLQTYLRRRNSRP
ncbi:hypothetical protein AAFP35_25735 [Gordonia sp. CPCC 206044]|uniref:hypothetical protein n=1 Tax=Gordonia sp. CPCC 206044 TaxID=3140793 RepID=UPI003AF3F341